MAKKVIPNCVEIKLHWLYGTVVGFNVLHAQRGSVTVNQALADGLFTTLAPQLNASGLAAVLHTTTGFQHVGVRDLSTADQPEFVSTGTAVSGTATGNILPPQVALCVTYKANLVGRSNRGRSYLGGFADSATTTQGRATPAATAAAQGFMQTVNATLAAQGLTPAIGQIALPQRTNAAGETLPARPAGTVPIVTTTVLDNIFDTQRRRIT